MESKATIAHAPHGVTVPFDKMHPFPPQSSDAMYTYVRYVATGAMDSTIRV